MLNFALIGCGHIAQRHAKQIAHTGQLKAVCDIQIDKAVEMAQHYNANVYANFSDLLLHEPDIDVIAVCTPNGLHSQNTIEALRSGMHVICEKPMAIKTSDCRLMIAEAKKAGKQLFVVKQNRLNPPVQAIKNLLDKKKLGNIYSVHVNCIWNRDASYYSDSWRGTMEMDGGILFTQFSHFIDLLYWMFGDVKDAIGYTKNFAHKEIIEFEDSGVACLQFENGILGSIHFSVNSYKKNMEGSVTIVAEKGTVKIGGEYLNELEYQLIENIEIGNLEKGNAANDYGTYRGSMSNHDKVYQHVADVILNNIPNQFNGLDGLKTVEIIEKIYKAAR
jgi:UDP-N-acetyl-2-amino-2-deoxyglucuronate dehydrogenase